MSHECHKESFDHARSVRCAGVFALSWQVQSVSAQESRVSSANEFNVNLKQGVESNAPPWEDGIHDTSNEATFSLQPPEDAYKGLPRTTFGNRVDWVNRSMMVCCVRAGIASIRRKKPSSWISTSSGR